MSARPSRAGLRRSSSRTWSSSTSPDQKAAGVALDMLAGVPDLGSDRARAGHGDYAESADSDIVVITSGVPRKPGMSRDDLLNVNYKIMQQVTEQVVKYSPDCIIIPVANPLDAMAQAIYKLSKFPRERVIGMAGVLDSARMRAFIAKELNVSVENVHAFVLGGHGDTMVPLPRYSNGGRNSDHRFDGQGDDRPHRRSHGQRRGRDHQARRNERVVMRRAPPSWRWSRQSCSTREDRAVLGLPAGRNTACATSFVGVPCKLGARGLEQVIEIKLTAEEDVAFKKSAAAVKELVGVIGV
jgi:malate dehydrogenase